MEIEENRETVAYDSEFTIIWFSIAKNFPDYINIPFFKNENNQSQQNTGMF